MFLRYNEIMLTTEELRRVLGPIGIWTPPPAGTGLDPAEYGQRIEAAGFTSVWSGSASTARPGPTTCWCNCSGMAVRSTRAG